MLVTLQSAPSQTAMSVTPTQSAMSVTPTQSTTLVVLKMEPLQWESLKPEICLSLCEGICFERPLVSLYN